MSTRRSVRIVAFELLAVDLPFRAPFRHSAATRANSESVFLSCVTDSGAVGFGECLPRTYVTGESRNGVLAMLRDRILPRLVGQEFASLAEVETFLAACDGRAPAGWVEPDTPQGAAWCAVDLALLDAFGRAFDEIPLHGCPGDLPPGFRFSGVLSSGRGLANLVSVLKQRLFGLRQIKVKVDRDVQEGFIRRVRRLAGRAIELRVDANMAWTVAEARARMQAWSRHGIRSFEQPIAADDLAGLTRLAAETGLSVMADESFTTRESLSALIEHRACSAVNARISKCGGLVATLHRCREALQAGLEVQIGCQVGESSLLSSAHLILSAAVADVRYAEGCFGGHLLREDPGSPILQFGFGGRPPHRPRGPGLGIAVDERLLARHAVRRERVPRTAAPLRAAAGS